MTQKHSAAHQDELRKRLRLVQRFERISDWLYAGDYEIECRQVSAVVTRFPHTCYSVYHGQNPKVIASGTLCIVERAKVEGKFGSCYTCKDCIRQSEKDTR